MGSDELERRVRALELKMAELDISFKELSKFVPLITKSYEGVKDITAILQGTLGAEGFVMQVSKASSETARDVKDLKLKQYFLFGGLAVMSVAEPIWTRIAGLIT